VENLSNTEKRAKNPDKSGSDTDSGSEMDEE